VRGRGHDFVCRVWLGGFVVVAIIWIVAIVAGKLRTQK
jgi:hypothetical protein